MAAVNVVNPTDPNVNNNAPLVNGIPKYENMFIFAELSAVRRGRTVLSTSVNGDITIFDKTGGFDSTVAISFLGETQDPNSPNNGNFTTNYYDGSTKNSKQYDGF